MNLHHFFQFACQVGVAKWAWRYGRWQFIKRILQKSPSMLLPTGKRIFLPRTSGSAAEVFVTDADIDWGSETLFASIAEAGDDFLDIGAHIGYYSLYLSPVVARVFAFEPDSRNLDALAINATTGGNISVIEKAVADTVGVQYFDVSHNSAVSHLTSSGAAKTIDVATVSIDEFVKSIANPRIKLIKIDIEGHDFNALKGAGNTILEHQPLILSEFSTEGLDINNPARLTRLCNDLRYKIFAYARQSSREAPYLREMCEADMGNVWVKMMFLVPERLQQAFRVQTGIA